MFAWSPCSAFRDSFSINTSLYHFGVNISFLKCDKPFPGGGGSLRIHPVVILHRLANYKDDKEFVIILGYVIECARVDEGGGSSMGSQHGNPAL